MTRPGPRGKAISSFVGRARAAPHPRLQFESWGDPTWTVEDASVLNDRYRRKLVFADIVVDAGGRETRRPWPELYGDFARAVCNEWANLGLAQNTAYALIHLSLALRFLHAEAIQVGSDPARIHAGHFTAAEDAIWSGRLSPETADNYASKLGWIAKLVDRIRPAAMNWTRSRFSDPEARFSLENMELKRRRKLLSEEDMLRWARMSADPGPSPFDRLRQRALDLMVCGGFRLSEGLSMPRDALVTEPVLDDDGAPSLDRDGQAVRRFGLRYWPSRPNGCVPMIKAIPTAMAPVAARAVGEALVLTRRAHAVAVAFSEGRSPYDEDPWDNLLGIEECILQDDEVAWLLGFRPDPTGRRTQAQRGREFIRAKGLAHWSGPSSSDAGKLALHVSKNDLERALRRISYDKYVKDTRHGRVSLQDCLFVIPSTMKRGLDGTDGTAELLGSKAVEYYLNENFPAPPGMRSVRPHGEDDLRVTSHTFRFWLNTAALEADLPGASLAAWMGRSQVKCNRQYDLRSQNGKVQRLGEALGAERDRTGPAFVGGTTFSEPVSSGVGGHATACGLCERSYAFALCDHVTDQLDADTYAAAVRDLTQAEVASLRDRLRRQSEADEAADHAEVREWLDANRRLSAIVDAATSTTVERTAAEFGSRACDIP